MTPGEDLLLLAVNPRNGRIWTVERIGPALRALELHELIVAGRVVLSGTGITIADQAPVGEPHLDAALATLGAGDQGLALDVWLRGQLPEPRPGIIKRYLDSLADAGAVRIDTKGEGVALRTRIMVLDEERRTRALARVEGAGQDGAAADPADRALAAIVVACGLYGYVYGGLRNRGARRRLEHLRDHSEIAAGTRAAGEAADAALANAIAQALSSGIAKFGRQLSHDMHRQQHAESQHHNSSSPGHHDGGGGHHGGHHAGHHG